MNRTCKVCSKEFHVKQSQVDRVRGDKEFNGGSYCSRECQNVGRKKRVVNTCLSCKSEFEVILSKKSQKFCDISCRASYQKGRAKKRRSVTGTKSIHCSGCDDLFVVPNRSDTKYCSLECYHKSRITIMKKSCLLCDESFKTTPAEIKRGGGLYCSAECNDKRMESHIVCECTHCKREFKTYQTVLDEGNGRFCSRACFGLHYSGERAPSYGKPPSHGNQGIKKDLGHYVRSSWEANYARFLNYKGIAYEYEPNTFSLVRSDGTKTTYTPDFFIGHWVEVKGFWRDDAIEKVKLFLEQYPNEKLEIVDKPVYKEIEKVYKKLIPSWE